MAGDPIEREVVSRSVFFALFRVVEIEELSGAEKAVEWAKAMVDERDLRDAFSEDVLKALSERRATPPGDDRTA